MRVRIGKGFFALIFIVAGMIVATFMILFMDFFVESPVLANVLVEAGSEIPEPEEFLTEEFKDKGYQGISFASNIENLSKNLLPGTYEIDILIGKKIYKSTVTIRDTQPPTGTFVNQTVFRGQKLPPEDFVTDVKDATPVKITFESTPRFDTPGEHIIGVVLTDKAGNITRLYGQLKVLDGNNTVFIEAGAFPLNIKLSDFVDIENESITASFETDISSLSIDLNTPGDYTVQIRVNGVVSDFTISVVDTTPPYAEPVRVETWYGKSVSAESFISSVYDISPLKAYFKTEPDWTDVNQTHTIIVLEDIYGNKTEILSELNVMYDIIPPVIYGLENKYILPGGSVAYRSGVSAIDEVDGEVEFTIDSTGVDIFTEGSYTVFYKATDLSGNEAVSTIEVVVTSVDPEAVYEMANAVLDRILKEGMTQYEQGRAIYTWARNNIKYVSSGDKDDIIKGAYNAFKLGSGDCYTYYAACELMLTMVGIPNFGIERIGGTTRHYWSLVNTGDGWYHFDSCPYREWFDGYMFTESKAQQYTRDRGRNYYVYDTSLVPDYIQVVWE